MDNMVKQWHSIEQVWNLMEEAENKLNIHYERVGLFRSDVLYANPIDIMDGNDDAVTPMFASSRANDRMFYGSYENARIWATIRFPSVECYRPSKKKYGLHSEQFMKDQILASMNTRVVKKDICFFRVRATGLVMSDDCRSCQVPHEDCDSIKGQDVTELVSTIVNKKCTPDKVKLHTHQELSVRFESIIAISRQLRTSVSIEKQVALFNLYSIICDKKYLFFFVFWKLLG